MKLERMLTIIVMLLNRKRVTATELAEKFNVSIRTIYRDIQTIDMAGIPIVSHSGNNGGFSIYDDYKLNHQVLTINNISSLLSILKDINSTVDDIEIESSIEKLQSIVPTNKMDQLLTFSEQIIIDIHPYGDSEHQKHLVKSIRQAISQSFLLTIEYANYDNSVNIRQIEPMSLIFKNYTWYLFSYCLLKEDYRLFRVSRIKDLKLTSTSFIRRDKSYHDISAAENDATNKVILVLKASSSMKARISDIFMEDDITELESGEFLIKTTMPEKDWLLSLIFSFGEFIEVLEPVELRDTVASKLRAMSNIYNNNFQT